MSKTETQSEAQKLSALLNVAMAFDHGRIGTDRRFVEMDATVVASVDAELRRLDAENKALRARLEIDPSHPIDGIAARDETIRQLEAQVKTLRPDAERWKAIRLGVPSGDRILRVYTMKQGCGTWLRGTDADFSIDAAMAAAKTGDAA